MNIIWANRLIAGTQVWSEVPDHRKDAILSILKERVASGKITAEKYESITGEAYTEEDT